MSEKIPQLELTHGIFTHEDMHQALIKFTQQASLYVPDILNSDRDKNAVKIHIENIEEQLSKSNQNIQTIINSLNSITKIVEKNQDDMLACVMLDYVDELIEMISTS